MLKERKITGVVVALEAANFGTSFVPILGEVPELFFGALPSVTLSRIAFAKYGNAKDAQFGMNTIIAQAKSFGIQTGDAQKALDAAKKHSEEDNPVKALEVLNKQKETLTQKIIDQLNQEMQVVTNELTGMPDQNGANRLYSQLTQAQNFAQNEQFKEAQEIIIETQNIMQSVTQNTPQNP
jgi:hypothetical protein